ncbi:10544_t:CDS:2 [Scutellospora calospora]|uniref:10544_t:CDS:1 n=1 Tax=Scutellospora calospora TaxID=85575 RepID=A0ACA9LK85_9GLOM|nr:10544_t:CDS:2 [Scutellospora calospora]
MSFILKSANVLGFLALVAIVVILELKDLNYFQNSNSQNITSVDTQSASNATGTYLTPTDYAFGIWFLVLPLLLCFVICQWFSWAEDSVTDGVSYFFFFQAALDVVLLILWVVDYYMRPDNIFAFTMIWILICIAVRQAEITPVFIVALAGIGLIGGGIFRNWVTFVIEWYAAYNFVELGGDDNYGSRNYRLEESYGLSGHHAPEIFDNNVAKSF